MIFLRPKLPKSCKLSPSKGLKKLAVHGYDLIKEMAKLECSTSNEKSVPSSSCEAESSAPVDTKTGGIDLSQFIRPPTHHVDESGGWNSMMQIETTSGMETMTLGCVAHSNPLWNLI
jgi:hypothetical protein